MTGMPALQNIANNTPGNAVPVDSNFETIETHIANELINRDGSVAMTGQLLLAGNPAAALGAAPKQYVDAAIPTGVVSAFAGAAAPSGWQLCDGTVLSQAGFAALFAVIGSTYNTGGEGAGNFRVPDLRTRVPIGRHASTSPFTVLGSAAGSKDAVVIGHSHTVGAHTHTTPSHQHNGSTGFVSNDHTHGFSWSGTTDAQGSHDHQTNASFSGVWIFGGGGDLGMRSDGTLNVTRFGVPSNISDPSRTSTVGSHAHNYSGSGSTGGISANHNHAFTTNNDGSGTSGPSSPATDTQGVTGTNLNLPPYLIVNYIIKT